MLLVAGAVLYFTLPIAAMIYGLSGGLHVYWHREEYHGIPLAVVGILLGLIVFALLLLPGRSVF